MLDENKNTNNENEEEVNLNESESELVTSEEVDSINEEVTSESNEQVNELETSEEVSNVENSSEVEAATDDKTVNKNSFFRSLKVALVDEIIIGIVSVILLYVTDFVLRAVGYFITEKISMLLIIFVVVSLLYPAIMESSKKGNTIGRSLK